jgi:hypothetical protein
MREPSPKPRWLAQTRKRASASANAGLASFNVKVDRRRIFGVRVVRSAELYRGVGAPAASPSLDTLILECDGDRRCRGMGDFWERTGMMQTRAFSLVKSLGESSSTRNHVNRAHEAKCPTTHLF